MIRYTGGLFPLFLLIILLSSCTTLSLKPSTPPQAPNTTQTNNLQEDLNLPKVKITINSTGFPKGVGPIPEWAQKSGEVYIGEGLEGKTYIYFVFEAEGESKEIVKNMAEEEAKTKVAESIKTAVLKQIARYMEGIEGGEGESYVMELTASVTKTVLSGLTMMGVYWEEFYMVYPNGWRVGPKYRYVVRYGLEYNLWKEMIKNAWNEIKQKVPKDIKEKIEKGINETTE